MGRGFMSISDIPQVPCFSLIACLFWRKSLSLRHICGTTKRIMTHQWSWHGRKHIHDIKHLSGRMKETIVLNGVSILLEEPLMIYRNNRLWIDLLSLIRILGGFLLVDSDSGFTNIYLNNCKAAQNQNGTI